MTNISCDTIRDKHNTWLFDGLWNFDPDDPPPPTEPDPADAVELGVPLGIIDRPDEEFDDETEWRRFKIVPKPDGWKLLALQFVPATVDMEGADGSLMPATRDFLTVDRLLHSLVSHFSDYPYVALRPDGPAGAWFGCTLLLRMSGESEPGPNASFTIRDDDDQVIARIYLRTNGTLYRTGSWWRVKAHRGSLRIKRDYITESDDGRLVYPCSTSHGGWQVIGPHNVEEYGLGNLAGFRNRASFLNWIKQSAEEI